MFKFMRKGNRGVGKNCMNESPLEIAPKDTYQVMKKADTFIAIICDTYL